MNLQAFLEKIVLRDLVAILLPGGLVLFGLTVLWQIIGESNDKLNIFSNRPDNWTGIIIFLFSAFLLGHIVDLIYRLLFQERDWYKCSDIIEKELTDPKIRRAIGEFLDVKLDGDANNLAQWIRNESGKANMLLRYWIVKTHPELYNSEIERVATQVHFLIAGGMSFVALAICCFVALIWNSSTNIVASALLAVVIGIGAICQGFHKRQILMQNIYRVFYVLWQKQADDEKMNSVGA